MSTITANHLNIRLIAADVPDDDVLFWWRHGFVLHHCVSCGALLSNHEDETAAAFAVVYMRGKGALTVRGICHDCAPQILAWTPRAIERLRGGLLIEFLSGDTCH